MLQCERSFTLRYRLRIVSAGSFGRRRARARVKQSNAFAGCGVQAFRGRTNDGKRNGTKSNKKTRDRRGGIERVRSVRAEKKKKNRKKLKAGHFSR